MNHWSCSKEPFSDGVPKGMTLDVVEYFKSHDIRVMVSMGGVTYTDAWNEALITDPIKLADLAFDLVVSLNLDGLEIDWENGRPTELQMDGMERFIERYNFRREGLDNHYLTLDLAVGNRYLQELSRRASADWLPNGKIDYINAMVPRGEPSIDQWQEHVDGKSNYDPPIAPKAPAKVAVSLWLTDGRRPNENCVDYEQSSMKDKLDYVQTVLPNGEGITPGFLGYMFWAAECPATRNVCTTPPNGCEGGMGVGAGSMEIPIPIPALRAE
ncbi:MAG: glycosyl hydrolase family 18 protein [Xanthomonadales bacterium]|nr:glycosyl hydrolase family 18 protein [Xanthomonadales bacterium]